MEGKKTFHVCLICNIWEDGGCLRESVEYVLLQKDGVGVHEEGSDGQAGKLGLNLKGTEACFLTRCQIPS